MNIFENHKKTWISGRDFLQCLQTLFPAPASDGKKKDGAVSNELAFTVVVPVLT